MKHILLHLITVYQKTTQPARVFFSGFGVPVGRVCPLEPTCSDYAKRAIQKYGLLRGGRKAFVRTVSCHPWRRSRIDYP